METVQLALRGDGAISYPIYIGEQLLDRTDLLTRHIQATQVLIITHQPIAALYLDKLTQILSTYDYEALILPEGEQYKNLATVNQIFEKLLTAHYDRSMTLCALGGGVIGDMAGFAASCYRRGVAYIQIPTTLLAQVDSAIGGKTGINHSLGKNMIGTFYHPQCVLIDINTLASLPNREFHAGLAEVVKYGLLADKDFFNWIEANADALLARNKEALLHLIIRSCTIKAKIVAADEKEQGMRTLLNLGHSFGHVIETATEYKAWRHGEAVACGMVMAAQLSYKEKMLSRADVVRIKVLLQRLSLPIMLPPVIHAQRFFDMMRMDKKAIARTLRLVLMDGIGEAVVKDDFKPEHLMQVIKESMV